MISADTVEVCFLIVVQKYKNPTKNKMINNFIILLSFIFGFCPFHSTVRIIRTLKTIYSNEAEIRIIYVIILAT